MNLQQYLPLQAVALALLILASPASPVSANENQVESFTLNDTRYEIPPPWSGNRIHAPDPQEMRFRRIPAEHVKNNGKIYITETTLEALLPMLAEAKEEGVHLVVESGYRSYGYQRKIFTMMLESGRTYEDIIRYVAPPGYSQHALGTALDFSPSNWRFAELDAYRWLRENGERFGFRESFPENNSLNYPWESWHWNYEGVKKEEDMPVTP